MYPENPEETQVIGLYMNMGYISDTQFVLVFHRYPPSSFRSCPTCRDVARNFKGGGAVEPRRDNMSNELILAQYLMQRIS